MYLFPKSQFPSHLLSVSLPTPAPESLPSSQSRRPPSFLKLFPLESSHVILQFCQRNFFQPCRLISCELACLLYQATHYWKAELFPFGASLCLKSTKDRRNSLSDHIPSQFPYFCSGNLFILLSCLWHFALASSLASVSHIPPSRSGLPSNCLSDSSQFPHSNCPTVIQLQPFTTWPSQWLPWPSP